MAETTGIEWADATFNPWWGCEKWSPGCTNCYAEADAKRYGHDVWGKDKPRRHMSDSYWKGPLDWNAKALAEGRRRRVFCASHADVGEDRRDLDDLRVRLFQLVMRTPNLDWLFLTKRPETWMQLLERARGAWLEAELDLRPGTRPHIQGTVYSWLSEWIYGFPPKNVWMGATVEDQRRVDRIEHLVAIPAEVRWLSMEPLLEEVTLPGNVRARVVDWIVVGGESIGGRAFNVEWARKLLRHCRTTKTAFFMKQLGTNPLGNDGHELVRLETKHKKGGLLEDMPVDLRVREYPRSAAA